MIYDVRRVGKKPQKQRCISVSHTVHLFVFTFSGSGINFPRHLAKTVESPLVTHLVGGSTGRWMPW